MAYIYKIENKINKKQYVGKTLISLEHRFKRHIQDSKRKGCEKRPLYAAFFKYGIDNFEISLLEECNDNISKKREIFWIHKLETLKYGYNATKGGDGTQLFDYEEIVNKYTSTDASIVEVSKIIGCCEDTVRTALRTNNIQTKNSF